MIFSILARFSCMLVCNYNAWALVWYYIFTHIFAAVMQGVLTFKLESCSGVLHSETEGEYLFGVAPWVLREWPAFDWGYFLSHKVTQRIRTRSSHSMWNRVCYLGHCQVLWVHVLFRQIFLRWFNLSVFYLLLFTTVHELWKSTSIMFMY